jgi:N-acylneuraminate cytidylyltransferase
MGGSAWAIIPARGGSKGIPCKNLQKVGGVPLIARAVGAALEAGTVERVFVTTDDPEIAAAARAAGSEVIHRPADLASDTASSEAALLHALDKLEEQRQLLPDVVAFVQCTSPFVEGGDIDGAVGALLAAGAACAITVSQFHGFLWRSDGHHLRGVNHDGISRQRRQDREKEFLENGAVYALRVADFRRQRSRFCGPIAFHEMPFERSLEIDDHHELEIARSIAPRFAKDTILRGIRGVVFDFDGVMTDNHVLVGQAGEESVLCSRSDGMGIEALRKLGLSILILSKEKNPVVSARATKLGVECIQGVDDKAPALESWARRLGADLAEIGYVGNDINDIPCLERVGIPIVVADSHPDVLRSARIVLARDGGRGAVREICDRICAALRAV